MMGALQTATSDASETMRPNTSASTKISTQVSVIQGSMTTNTPRVVATPLPPRKRRKTLKPLPMTAAMAETTTHHGSSPSRVGTITAATPFRGSISMTASAGHGPTERRTLVAPMFPEPAVRMSMPRMRATISPVGMAPTKYANSTTARPTRVPVIGASVRFGPGPRRVA